MFSVLARGLLLAVLGLVVSGATAAGVVPGGHRADVDVSRYPWSAIGKLYNESGSACSAVLIGADKVLTAAHCLYNRRSQRFIAPESLHFLIGYRMGRYAAHVRIARYEIGPGFDPLRYRETSSSDWAILTVRDGIPAGTAPLRLSRDLAPSGTRAAIAGYPQDRAHAMTADLDCELRDRVGEGRLFLHTCRGINGYSGAPILVGAGDEVRVAGIQIATIRGDGPDRMLAVPARAVWHFEEETTASIPRVPVPKPAGSCDPAGAEGGWGIADLQFRLDVPTPFEAADTALPVARVEASLAELAVP